MNLSIIKKVSIFVLLILLTSCHAWKIPRCPIPNCHTKLIHLHKETEFRGRPWWKRNQNPKIGELHPTIVHDHSRNNKPFNVKHRMHKHKKVKVEIGRNGKK